MKVALVSDIHIHDWAEHRVMEGAIPSRLAHCVDVLEDVRMYCNKRGIGVVIIAGDLFHKRNVIYTLPYQLVVEKLAQMRRDGLTVLAVDGNHDHANKQGTVHVIDTLWSADLVTEAVPIKDGWVNWHLEADGDELVVSAFSYCDDRETLEQRMELSTKEYNALHAGVPRIGVFHHGFKGAKVGSALEYVVKEDIDASVMEGLFAFVYSGHYHHAQRIADMDNALYIGAPLEHVRGEGGAKRGFRIYDSKTNTDKLIPLHRPRFVKYEYGTLDSDALVERVRGNFVDVIHELSPSEWSTFEASLRRIGAAGVKGILQRNVKEVTTTKRLDIDPTLDTKTILERYVKHKEEDIKHLDQKELLRIGQQLYEKAGK